MAKATMMVGHEPLIKDYIRGYNSEVMNFDTCFLKQGVPFQRGVLVINDSSVLEKYMSELEAHKIRYPLSNIDHVKYQYNPKLFSYDLYGTTELWFLILHANELYSANEFDVQNPWVYDGMIYDIVTRIIDLEKPYIDINQGELTSIIKGE